MIVNGAAGRLLKKTRTCGMVVVPTSQKNGANGRDYRFHRIQQGTNILAVRIQANVYQHWPSIGFDRIRTGQIERRPTSAPTLVRDAIDLTTKQRHRSLTCLSCRYR
jgi:hypothetical protein